MIDATESLMAVHQNHSYGVKGEAKAIWTGPEAVRNLELAGGYDCVFSLEDATHCIRNHCIQRAGISRRRLRREVNIYPVLHPESPFVARVLKKMVAALRPAPEKESGL